MHLIPRYQRLQQFGNRDVEASRALRDYARELMLLGLDRFRHSLSGLDKFRISVLHKIANGENHVVHEGLFLTQSAAVTNGAADDLAQYVAASLVGWLHTIRNEKGCSTRVIRDDSKGWIIEQALAKNDRITARSALILCQRYS